MLLNLPIELRRHILTHLPVSSLVAAILAFTSEKQALELERREQVSDFLLHVFLHHFNPWLVLPEENKHDAFVRVARYYQYVLKYGRDEEPWQRQKIDQISQNVADVVNFCFIKMIKDSEQDVSTRVDVCLKEKSNLWLDLMFPTWRTGKKNQIDLLILASQLGNLPMVQALLNAGADVNVRDRFGQTPLHQACLYGHLAVVQFLLKKVPERSIANGGGVALLQVACVAGHLPVVQFLLENGATVNAPTRDGPTPLHLACEKGHLLVMQFLLEKGGDLGSLTNCETPLSLAWQKEMNIKIAGFLLEQGADVNSADCAGYTSLFSAFWHNRFSIVRLLIEKGAELNRVCTLTGYDALHFQERAALVQCLHSWPTGLWRTLLNPLEQRTQDVGEAWSMWSAGPSEVSLRVLMGNLKSYSDAVDGIMAQLRIEGARIVGRAASWQALEQENSWRNEALKSRTWSPVVRHWLEQPKAVRAQLLALKHCETPQAWTQALAKLLPWSTVLGGHEDWEQQVLNWYATVKQCETRVWTPEHEACFDEVQQYGGSQFAWYNWALYRSGWFRNAQDADYHIGYDWGELLQRGETSFESWTQWFELSTEHLRLAAQEKVLWAKQREELLALWVQRLPDWQWCWSRWVLDSLRCGLVWSREARTVQAQAAWWGRWLKLHRAGQDWSAGAVQDALRRLQAQLQAVPESMDWWRVQEDALSKAERIQALGTVYEQVRAQMEFLIRIPRLAAQSPWHALNVRLQAWQSEQRVRWASEVTLWSQVGAWEEQAWVEEQTAWLVWCNKGLQWPWLKQVELWKKLPIWTEGTVNAQNTDEKLEERSRLLHEQAVPLMQGYAQNLSLWLERDTDWQGWPEGLLEAGQRWLNLEQEYQARAFRLTQKVLEARAAAMAQKLEMLEKALKAKQEKAKLERMYDRSHECVLKLCDAEAKQAYQARWRAVSSEWTELPQHCKAEEAGHFYLYLEWWIELHSLVWMSQYYAAGLDLLRHDYQALRILASKEFSGLDQLSQLVGWTDYEMDIWADIWHESLKDLTFGRWLDGQLAWIESGFRSFWQGEAPCLGSVLKNSLGVELIAQYEVEGVVEQVDRGEILPSLLSVERYKEWQSSMRHFWENVLLRLQTMYQARKNQQQKLLKTQKEPQDNRPKPKRIR